MSAKKRRKRKKEKEEEKEKNDVSSTVEQPQAETDMSADTGTGEDTRTVTDKNTDTDTGDNTHPPRATVVARMRAGRAFFARHFQVSRVRAWITRRDIGRSLVAGVVVLLLFSAYAGGRWHETVLRHAVAVQKEDMMEAYTQEHLREVAAIQDRVDQSAWTTYRNAWYGFTIAHPAQWQARQVGKTADKNRAIYRVRFTPPATPLKEHDTTSATSSSPQNGFEVAVYDLRTTPQVTDTDEYPQAKTVSADQTATCQPLVGRLFETGDYPAEEFYVPFDDPCFDTALFYMLVDGQYMYTIVPFVDDANMGDPMVTVTDRVPEYFAAVSRFENVDIVRPKPKPVVPAVNAPMPAWYVHDAAGRKVCAKKNDKPGKSKTNKKKHMDMECCLDPDEYPNSHCYYDPGKYGKYL